MGSSTRQSWSRSNKPAAAKPGPPSPDGAPPRSEPQETTTTEAGASGAATPGGAGEDADAERRRRRSFEVMTKMMGGEAKEAAELAAEKMHGTEDGPGGSTIKAMEMAGVARAAEVPPGAASKATPGAHISFDEAAKAAPASGAASRGAAHQRHAPGAGQHGGGNKAVGWLGVPKQLTRQRTAAFRAPPDAATLKRRSILSRKAHEANAAARMKASRFSISTMPRFSIAV